MGDAMDLSPVSKLTTNFQDMLHATDQPMPILARKNLFSPRSEDVNSHAPATATVCGIAEACAEVPLFKKPFHPASYRRTKRHTLNPDKPRRGGSLVVDPASPSESSSRSSSSSSLWSLNGPSSCELPTTACRSERTHGYSGFGPLSPVLPEAEEDSARGELSRDHSAMAANSHRGQPHEQQHRKGTIGSCPMTRRATVIAASASSRSSCKSLPVLLPRLSLDHVDEADKCASMNNDEQHNKENVMPLPNNSSSSDRGGASPYRPPLFSLTASSSAVMCSSPSSDGRIRSGSLTDRSHRQSHFYRERSSPVALFAASPSIEECATRSAKENAKCAPKCDEATMDSSPYDGAMSPPRRNLDRDQEQETSPFAESGVVPTAASRRNKTRIGRALTISCSSLPTLAQPIQPLLLGGPNEVRPFYPEAHVPALPTNPNASHSDLPCIEPTTLIRLLSGEYDSIFSRLFIVDCRFKYEFDGGHIRGAINLNTTQDVEKQFVLNPSPLREKVCIIFHCEFSSHRGPVLWDRRVHERCYPELYYPEMYVLEGGYKKFWETPNAQAFCEPQAYVPMKDSKFSQEMKNGLASIRNFSTKKNRASFRSRSWTVDSREGGSSSMPAVRPVRFPHLPSPLSQQGTSIATSADLSSSSLLLED